MEGLSFSLSVMLLGMLVVFTGLIILIFSIVLMSKLVGGEAKPKKEVKAVAAAPAPVAAPVVATPVAAESGVPAEVLAAITAAISAVWDNARGGFTVKHVRRVSNAPAWNRAGREEQTYSRF